MLAVVAWSPAPVQALREALFDTYQRLYPRERKSAPVTIVEIDEATLSERGQWPWPRTLVAELVSKIAKESPAAIGLDLLFPEPDRFSPAEAARSIPDLPDDVAKRLQALPSNDARLAEAIRGRKVVLALAGLEAADPRFARPPGAVPVRLSTAAETQLRAFPGYLASIPEIDRAAAGRGLISVDSAERIVRRVPMLAKVAGSTVPALSLELWRIASGASELTVSEAGAGVLEMSFADAKIPVQRDGSMWLRYSRHEPARFVSASDILSGRASAEQLHSRIVLIGVTGLGLLDYKATPLGEQVPGVELHAQLIEQIFDGTYLVRPAWAPWLELVLLALGAGLLIALVPGVRVRYSVITLIALVLITVVAAAGAFAAGVLLDAAWPTLGFAAAFSVLIATTLSEADRQRRELREAAARSAGELEAARRIQMGLLPDPVALFGAEPGFALRALVQPALTVGGDFYDCFKLDEERLFFVVGDVSGKGMPAALFMALCKATIKAAVITAGGDPGAALRRAATEIGRDNPEAFFVTVFAATLHLDSGSLRYCNAGHEPPYARHARGLARLPTASRPPIGVPDTFPFATETLQLAPGEWLCVLTDGVTEAMNERGELYGAQRLARALGALPADSSPDDITAVVLEDVKRFVSSASASDDLTLLALRRSSGR